MRSLFIALIVLSVFFGATFVLIYAFSINKEPSLMLHHNARNVLALNASKLENARITEEYSVEKIFHVELFNVVEESLEKEVINIRKDVFINLQENQVSIDEDRLDTDVVNEQSLTVDEFKITSLIFHQNLIKRIAAFNLFNASTTDNIVSYQLKDESLDNALSLQIADYVSQLFQGDFRAEEITVVFNQTPQYNVRIDKQNYQILDFELEAKDVTVSFTLSGENFDRAVDVLEIESGNESLTLNWSYKVTFDEINFRPSYSPPSNVVDLLVGKVLE